MKAAVGDHQILRLLAVNLRPISAGDDWPVYGYEYGRMKFDNAP